MLMLVLHKDALFHGLYLKNTILANIALAINIYYKGKVMLQVVAYLLRLYDCKSRL
jgi:hypothetical protein